MDPATNNLLDIGCDASGSDEIKCELFGDGGGGRNGDYFNGGLGDDEDVAVGGRLLDSLEKCAGLTESVLQSEIS